MASAPIDVEVVVKGLASIKKLERQMEALDKEVAGLNRGLPRASNNIRGFGGAARRASAGFAMLNKAMLKVAAVIAAIRGATFVFTSAAELESQAKSLEILTGSAQKAAEVIGEIQDFSAVTPFTSSELIDTTKRLKAFGVETENLVKTTKMLADVSGATGAKINEVALAYGQVQAKGKLQTEELYQLQERGIGIADELKRMYGLTGEEFVKALEKGQISAKAVEQAFINLTGTSGKYFNGATAQSETLAGKWSTLIDAVTRLAQNLGQTLGPALKGILTLAINITNAIVGMIQKINQLLGIGTENAVNKLERDIASLEDRLGANGGRRDAMMRSQIASKKAELATLRAELEKTAEVTKEIDTNLLKLTGGDDGSGSSSGKSLSDGSAEVRNLEQQLALLGAKNDLSRELLQIRFDEENAIKRIQEAVAAGGQADAIRLQGLLREKQERLAIAQFTEDALARADQLINSTNQQIEADARRRELIAEGINPALADSLVAIEQQFEPVKKILDEKILTLETTIEQFKAEGKVTEELEKQLDLIKKKRQEIEGAEGAAKGNANKEDPGKIEQYIQQLETDLADFEGMVVSLAGTIESELSSAMSNAIMGIIDGTQTAEEAFANMFKNIGKAFIDMATQMIAKALIMKALGILFPGGGGGFGVQPATSGLDFSSAFSSGGFGIGGFAGGGYTGDAPRAGGLDGQGGFMAMLHPQESVVDHTQSSSRQEAMAMYSMGNQDMAAGAPMTTNITYSGPTLSFNGDDYIPRSEASSLVAAGAKQGEIRAMNRLRQSRSTRSKVGM